MGWLILSVLSGIMTFISYATALSSPNNEEKYGQVAIGGFFFILFIVSIINNKKSKRRRMALKVSFDKQLQETNFYCTKKIGTYFELDEGNKLWLVPDGKFGKIENPLIHSYHDILDFELLEDGGSVAKGGVGRAITGGLLFGGVGAIVGASTRKTKAVVNRLQIKITLKNMNYPVQYINLILTPTKTDSAAYRYPYSCAQQILSVLSIITNENSVIDNVPEIAATATTDNTEDLRKYKQLLDEGIITQEEFESKKRQLLGL